MNTLVGIRLLIPRIFECNSFIVLKMMTSYPSSRTSLYTKTIHPHGLHIHGSYTSAWTSLLHAASLLHTAIHPRGLLLSSRTIHLRSIPCRLLMRVTTRSATERIERSANWYHVITGSDITQAIRWMHERKGV